MAEGPYACCGIVWVKPPTPPLEAPDYEDGGLKKRQSQLAPDASSGIHDFRFHGKTGSWSSWVEPGAKFVIPKWIVHCF